MRDKSNNDNARDNPTYAMHSIVENTDKVSLLTETQKIIKNYYNKRERGLKSMEHQKIDMVNHPSHYKAGKYETIDVIDSTLGDNFEGYYTGNILKYVSRYKHKNGVEDLKKARWYLDRLIGKLDKPETLTP